MSEFLIGMLAGVAGVLLLRPFAKLVVCGWRRRCYYCDADLNVHGKYFNYSETTKCTRCGETMPW